MTKPSTLEKVARALFAADCELCCDYVMLPETWEGTKRRPAYTALARAALQSLRQVDDETVEAMAVCISTDYPLSLRGMLPEAFTAAIDHILTEGGER